MWEKTPWWTYSLDNELSFLSFPYESKGQAINAAMEDAEIEGAKRVYVGRLTEYIPTVDAESVINQVQFDGADAAAEEDVSWPFERLDKVADEDFDELKYMLTETYRKWEDKHGYTSGVYKITDIEEFQARARRATKLSDYEMEFDGIVHETQHREK